MFGISPLEKASYPKVDVVDEENSVVFEVEIPSYRKDNVKITFSENILTIQGSRDKKLSEQNRRRNYIRHELSRSSFRRSFIVNNPKLDTDRIEAKFSEGLLTITIPKKAAQKREEDIKQIEIK